MTLDEMYIDAYGKETEYSRKHQVNCAIDQKACSFCLSKDSGTSCNICKEKQSSWMKTVQQNSVSGCLVRNTKIIQSLHTTLNHRMDILS